MVNPTCRDGEMYPPPFCSLSDCKKSRCNRGERRSTRTSRGPYGTFERIQGVSVHRGKIPRSCSPCEPLLASHKKTRRRCWPQATHERKRFCAVARVHCFAAHSILLASQSGLDQKGVFGSQRLQSETGSWEEIRLGPTQNVTKCDKL